jgi:S-adenosylmethionine:tRNA ribosyltransferase-isomerase
MNTSLRLSDYTYELPEERIALFPETRRDQSKLMVCKGSHISHHVFSELPGLLGPDDFLVLNNTRVFQARLFFRKQGGGIAEILLLEPIGGEIGDAMEAKARATWRCMMGNARNWKRGSLQAMGSVPGAELTATRSESDASVVHLEWQPSHLTLGYILEKMGHVPLPPYLHRADVPEDKERYQTVFAKESGSVAAPTASLHFTPGLLSGLRSAGIESTQITLHVGAGTFLPIKTDDVSAHKMHGEFALISRQSLHEIIRALQSGKRIIAVGTTATRTLESLYWAAYYLSEQGVFPEYIEQWVWDNKPPQDPLSMLQKLYDSMQVSNIPVLRLNIALMIIPGYPFQLTNGLITNFHQPASTLVLLVAAFVGDVWTDIYRDALSGNYRFLSYGDSSLLLP